MKMYQVFCNELSEIEIVSDTEKYVTLLNGNRCQKRSGYRCFFPTWQEAKDALAERENEEIRRLQREIEFHQKRLEKINALVQP